MCIRDRIQSVQGCNGGYQLAKNAEDATLYDVVKVIEGGIKINRCLEEDRFCSRDAAEWCTVHTFFQELQDGFIERLDSVRIRDLCQKPEKQTAAREYAALEV